MAPIPPTTPRVAGRPRKSASASESSITVLKKRRYIPGGPGGGGRYVDEDGTEIPVGGTGPGGYNYVGPRGRVGRENAEKGLVPVVYPSRSGGSAARSSRASARNINPTPRRHSPTIPRPQAISFPAMARYDDVPREERGFEEFHPDLDIYEELPIFTADEVDGVTISTTSTKLNQIEQASSEVASYVGNGREISVGRTPRKRRPGRPSLDVNPSASQELAVLPASVRFPPLPIQYAENPKRGLDQLHKPSFRMVDSFSKYSRELPIITEQLAKCGYNGRDGSESFADVGDYELVEYNMDLVDRYWLEDYNKRRGEKGIGSISNEILEITITKIEREWYNLRRRIPKSNPKPPQTNRPRSGSAAAVNGEPAPGEEPDSKCAICDDGDAENANAIIFCDGCNLAVHQDCYGVPFIPEGQWLCRKCMTYGAGILTCVFCPNSDGAFKALSNSTKWAHSLCAMWIPEVSLANHTYMEPIMDVERVPRTRWKLTCYICKQKMGACIQCSNRSCYTAFHVTCARRCALYLKMKNENGMLLEVAERNPKLIAYCHKHCSVEYSEQNNVQEATRQAIEHYKRTMKGRIWVDSQAAALQITNAVTQVDDAESHAGDSNEATSGAVANAVGDKNNDEPEKPVWKTPAGAPFIPKYIFDIVLGYLARFDLDELTDWVEQATKYWTLKVESRSNATLIKRYQNDQTETFSSDDIPRRDFANMPGGREKLERRISLIKTIKKSVVDLREVIQAQTEMEYWKGVENDVQLELLELIYFPWDKHLKQALRIAIETDVKGFFVAELKALLGRYEGAEPYLSVPKFLRDFSSVFRGAITRTFQLEGSVSKEVTMWCSHAKKIIQTVKPHLEASVRTQIEPSAVKSAASTIENLLASLGVLLDASFDLTLIESSLQGNTDDSVMSGAEPASVDLVEDADQMDFTEGTSPQDDDEASRDKDAVSQQLKSTAFPNDGNKLVDTPPDTTGYVTPHEHGHSQAPTPPVSNAGPRSTNGKDSSSETDSFAALWDGFMDQWGSCFMKAGAIPPAMRKFKPEGQSVLDPASFGIKAPDPAPVGFDPPKFADTEITTPVPPDESNNDKAESGNTLTASWVGRDVLPSEELSELDDAEFHGLEAPAEAEDPESDANADADAVPPTQSPEKPEKNKTKKGKGKAKKRRYR